MKRKISIKSVLLGCLLASYPLTAFEAYDESDYKNQLYTTITELNVGNDEQGHKIFYKVQPANNQYLYLGPNEVFFGSIVRLACEEEVPNPAMELNKGVEYGYISKFGQQGDEAFWGLVTTTEGNLHADVIFSATLKDVGTILTFQIDDLPSNEMTITNEMVESGTFFFDIPTLSKGFHSLKMTVTKNVKNPNFKLFALRFEGSGITNAYVARERWRPKAAYSNWRSSKNPNDVQAWIMELSSESELGHYSPCTTEFGYFGPIFEPGGTVKSVNMSIWSSSNEEGLLPIDKQSHLLGIGSGDATFGYWNHEGHGTKVREWNLFEGNTSKKYVIGLRYSNDGKFRTFYGYFWNEVTQNWQLYSVGRKYSTEPLTKLKTNSFIEVVGGSGKERSNHSVRKVNYKGWVCDSKGTWTDLDQSLSMGKKEISNHNRGVNQDGETFYTTTGGLKNKLPKALNKLYTKKEVVNRPLYMDPSKLQGFFKLPFIPQIVAASKSVDNVLSVEFQTHTPLASTVTVCSGSLDALSNQKNWEHSIDFHIPEGDETLVHKVNIPVSAETRFVRILVQDPNAQMWNFDTYTLGNH